MARPKPAPRHCKDCGFPLKRTANKKVIRCADCHRDRLVFMPSPERIAEMTAQFREEHIEAYRNQRTIGRILKVAPIASDVSEDN